MSYIYNVYNLYKIVYRIQIIYAKAIFTSMTSLLKAPSVQFSSVAQSCPTLWHHESQHARPPCPSSTPGVYSNPCPLSRWCHPAISFSVVPFSCPQSFPALGSFPMSQLFAWGGLMHLSQHYFCLTKLETENVPIFCKSQNVRKSENFSGSSPSRPFPAPGLQIHPWTFRTSGFPTWPHPVVNWAQTYCLSRT